MTGENNRSRIDLLLFGFSVLVGLMYLKSVWTLGDDGLSRTTQRLPYWDFSNLWAGGRLILDGYMDWLFDPEKYRAWLRSVFSPALPDQEWSYPPTLFFIAVPLGALPILPAYLVWTTGTLYCLHRALRLLRLPVLLHIMALLAPAVWINAAFGQNGALTAALLLGGLALLPSRPILAGALLGLLAIKPHLAILAPVAVLASRNWHAFFAAAATSLGLTLLTGLVFGFAVWGDFLSVTMPLISGIMEAPYPQSYHSHAVTAFIVGRWLGLELSASYAVQAVFTLMAALTCAVIWRPSSRQPHERRVALTALLSIVATPYGYSYDMVSFSVAVVALGFARPDLNRLLLLPFWCLPFFVHLLNRHGFAVGVFFPVALALGGLWLDRREITGAR